MTWLPNNQQKKLIATGDITKDIFDDVTININFVYSEDADSRLSPRVISDEDNNTISIEKVCEIYLHAKIPIL